MQDEGLNTSAEPVLALAGKDSEVQSLRRCMRDLASLSALSSEWAGYDPLRLAQSLIVALRGTLTLDLVFVRINIPSIGADFDVAWTASHGNEPADRPPELGRALAPWLTPEPAIDATALPGMCEDRPVTISANPLGPHHLGTLVVGSTRPDFPTEAERLLLSVAVSQASVVLQQREGDAERGHALTREQSHIRQLQHLSRISLAINSARALPNLLRIITDSAREILGAHQAITRLTGETEPTRSLAVSLLPSASGAPSESGPEWDTTCFREDLANLVCTGNQPLRLTAADLRNDPAWRGPEADPEQPIAARAWMGVPLVGRNGRNLGLVQLSHREGEAFTTEDEAILVQLTQLASVAVENARLDEQLRSSEEQFRTLVEQSPLSIQVLSPQGETLQVNRAWEQLWGATLEHLKAFNYNMLQDPELVAHGVMPYIQRGFGGEAVSIPPIEYNRTTTLPHLIGEEQPSRWTRAQIYPVRNEAGVIQKVVLIHEDFTDRKLLEDALAQRVEELAVSSRRKDEFLAMLAHELRNPLAPIRNAAQLLKLRSQTDPSLETLQAIVERQVGHLTRLVDDLLDVARITRGQIDLHKADLDLREIVDEAVEAVRETIEAREHRLTLHMPDTPLGVRGDRTRIVQIIGNILTNAAKYTPNGGHLEVIAEWEERGDGPRVALRIRDNGQGIAPDLLPHVFELFTQAARTLDRSEGGLGIGLKLVKELVEQHGGTVEAHSGGPGLGSEFTVRLPALTDSPSASTVSSPDPVAPGLPKRVLLVEDNADAAATLQELLKDWGHTVQVARDGPAALVAAAHFHPEVVLLDIGLPMMDGYEVARRLRDEGLLGDALLIAVTGYGHDEHREAAAAAGFHHRLVKPVDLDELLRLLSVG